MELAERYNISNTNSISLKDKSLLGSTDQVYEKLHQVLYSEDHKLVR